MGYFVHHEVCDFILAAVNYTVIIEAEVESQKFEKNILKKTHTYQNVCCMQPKIIIHKLQTENIPSEAQGLNCLL